MTTGLVIMSFARSLYVGKSEKLKGQPSKWSQLKILLLNSRAITSSHSQCPIAKTTLEPVPSSNRLISLLLLRRRRLLLLLLPIPFLIRSCAIMRPYQRNMACFDFNAMFPILKYLSMFHIVTHPWSAPTFSFMLFQNLLLSSLFLPSRVHTIYTTKIDGVVCPPTISETVAGRLMKLAHHQHIASTTIQLISKLFYCPFYQC